MQHLPVFGKSWRIENDEIILIAHAVEIVESVFAERLMTRIVRIVELNIVVGEIDCLLRHIDRMYELCPSAHGIEREATSVAEHIEYLATLAELLNQGTVLTLINEETCLLSLEPIDMKLQSILDSHIADRCFECLAFLSVFDLLAIDDQVAIHSVFGCLSSLRLIAQRSLRLVIHIADIGTCHTHQVFGQGLADVVDSLGMSLHDSRAVIDIYDESWQSVAFSMHKAEGIVVGTDQTERLTQVVGRLESLQEKFLAELLIAESEQSHSDAANLILANAKEVARLAHHLNPVAFLGLDFSTFFIEHPVNSSAEHPRMESLD